MIPAFEIQPYREQNLLVLGVPGKASIANGRVSIQGVSGVPGAVELLAVKGADSTAGEIVLYDHEGKWSDLFSKADCKFNAWIE